MESKRLTRYPARTTVRTMSFIDRFKRTGASGFGARTTAEEVTVGLDLTGKNILITGANSGLGKETARVLGLRGAHIFCAARTAEKAEAVASALQAATPVVCELTDLKSVVAVSEGLGDTKLDAVICNAGIMAPTKFEAVQGIERQFFTNHIGHFALVTGLLDRLTDDARVVVVSSYGHTLAPMGKGIDFDNLGGERGYRPVREYGQSKLANLLFARALARRFEGTARIANAVHPGTVDTNLGRENRLLDKVWQATKPLYTKPVERGAATQCYVAAHPDLSETSGEYFADCNIHGSSAKAEDEALGERLWTVSEEIVKRVLT